MAFKYQPDSKALEVSMMGSTRGVAGDSDLLGTRS
jgi:hypothetical protein